SRVKMARGRRIGPAPEGGRGRRTGSGRPAVNQPACRAVQILRYRSNMIDAELTRALERCEPPQEGFPHASHLRVAWTYLCESATVDAAVDRMAATLRRFAASVGQASKYSQPITVFWLYQLAAVRALTPDADCGAALRAYPWLLDKNLVLAHDSFDDASARAADSPGDSPHRPLPR